MHVFRQFHFRVTLLRRLFFYQSAKLGCRKRWFAWTGTGHYAPSKSRILRTLLCFVVSKLLRKVKCCSSYLLHDRLRLFHDSLNSSLFAFTNSAVSATGDVACDVSVCGW